MAQIGFHTIENGPKNQLCSLKLVWLFKRVYSEVGTLEMRVGSGLQKEIGSGLLPACGSDLKLNRTRLWIVFGWKSVNGIGSKSCAGSVQILLLSLMVTVVVDRESGSWKGELGDRRWLWCEVNRGGGTMMSGHTWSCDPVTISDDEIIGRSKIQSRIRAKKVTRSGGGWREGRGQRSYCLAAGLRRGQR